MLRNDLKETLNVLDTYRDDYSIETAAQIGKLKNYIMDANDAHFHASQRIYEWIKLTASHLKLYIKFFSGYDAQKAERQKQFSLEMLDSGIGQLSLAKGYLDITSINFHSASSRLSSLRDEFAKKKTYFEKILKSRLYKLRPFEEDKKAIHNFMDKLNAVLTTVEKMRTRVLDALVHIIDGKKMLTKQIQHFTDLKKLNQETVRMEHLDEKPDLCDKVIESAKQLIGDSEKFQKRHNDKYNSKLKSEI